jgi:hypothetical protein
MASAGRARQTAFLVAALHIAEGVVAAVEQMLQMRVGQVAQEGAGLAVRVLPQARLELLILVEVAGVVLVQGQAVQAGEAALPEE